MQYLLFSHQNSLKFAKRKHAPYEALFFFGILHHKISNYIILKTYQRVSKIVGLILYSNIH